jgi:conjugal transfer/type IV secretion protein DotA/TraY
MSTTACLPINKRLIQALCLLLLCLACLHTNIAFASDISNYCGPDSSSGTSSVGHANLFEPCPEDFSVSLLQQIFGTVSPVLASSNGETILGILLHLFAAIIMPLCVAFAGYATLMGIISSAADGEAMGREMSSIWVPIRTSAGIALLLPLGSGYCAAQAFIMWVCLQGIGAADYLWGTTAHYFAEGGSTTAVVVDPGETNPSQNLTTLMVGLSCRQYSNLITQEKSFLKSTQSPSLFIAPALDAPTFEYGTTGPSEDASYVTLNFSAPNTSTSCGSISWDKSNLYNYGDDNLDDPIKGINSSNALESAIEASLPMLNTMSYQLAVNMLKEQFNQPTDDYFKSNSSEDIQSYLENTYSQTFYNNSLLNTWSGPIINASTTTSSDSEDQDTDDPFSKGEKFGWLSAGGLYYKMVKAKSSTSDNGEGFIDSNTLCDSYSLSACFLNPPTTSGGPYKAAYDGINGFIGTRQDGASPDGDNDQLTKFTKAMKSPGAGASLENLPSTLTSLYMGKIFKDFSTKIQGDKDGSGENPIVAIASAGHKMVRDAQIMYAIWFAAVVAAGAIMGIGSCVSPGATVFKGMMSSLTPVIMAYTGIVATLGGGLAVYLPLIPFLIFSVAAMGWLISMVEANIAMPICAAFLAHPEGHKVWGKIEPTIMLIINMFLRPSLLIIGLVAAMVIAPAAVSIINFGIGQVVTDLYSSKHITPMESLLIITIYVTIITSVLNKVFGTIHKVPDQVMRWVAGGEQAQFGGGTEQDMGAIGQGSEKGERLSSGGTDANEKASSGAMETGSSKAGAKHNKDREDLADSQREEDVAARDKSESDQKDDAKIEDKEEESS